MAETDASTALWRFAVATYGQDGVAERCLALQDRLGLDVPLALFCLYAGLVHGRLAPEAAETAAALSIAWREAAVRPLRAVRREMKPRVEALEALGLEAGALRERIKALELEAERQQLAALAPLAALSEGPNGVQAARANLAACDKSAAAGIGAEDWALLLQAGAKALSGDSAKRD